MIRTQISLDRDQYRLAKAEANRLGISLAEFFRRALDAALPVPGKKPWMKYAGLVASGDQRSSRDIDDLIHGQKD